MTMTDMVKFSKQKFSAGKSVMLGSRLGEACQRRLWNPAEGLGF